MKMPQNFPPKIQKILDNIPFHNVKYYRRFLPKNIAVIFVQLISENIVIFSALQFYSIICVSNDTILIELWDYIQLHFMRIKLTENCQFSIKPFFLVGNRVSNIFMVPQGTSYLWSSETGRWDVGVICVILHNYAWLLVGLYRPTIILNS